MIQGNRVGPTVISVSHGGHAAATATANHLDSMLYTSMDEPHSQSANFSCTRYYKGQNSHSTDLDLKPKQLAKEANVVPI